MSDGRKEPTDRAEFEQALDELLLAAHGNGIDVRNGVALRHDDPDVPDWGIEIQQLKKPADRE